MPSAFTHAIAAGAIGSAVVPDRRKLIALGAVCAVLPDADVIGFRLGIPYEDMLGHRGLTHSVAFAALLAGLATWIAARRWARDAALWRVGGFLFLATVSHGLLDAMTDGGLGVAGILTGSGSLPLANPGPPRSARRSRATLAPKKRGREGRAARQTDWVAGREPGARP